MTANPTGGWIAQQARNLAMHLGARLEELRFLIRDRDTKYATMFDAVFEADASEIINTPPCAPRANAICERLAGTLHRELPDRIPIAGPGHARRILGEYAARYNGHRPRQSPNQRPPNAAATTVPAAAGLDERRIRCNRSSVASSTSTTMPPETEPRTRSSEPESYLRAAQDQANGETGKQHRERCTTDCQRLTGHPLRASGLGRSAEYGAGETRQDR